MVELCDRNDALMLKEQNHAGEGRKACTEISALEQEASMAI